MKNILTLHKITIFQKPTKKISSKYYAEQYIFVTFALRACFRKMILPKSLYKKLIYIYVALAASTGLGACSPGNVDETVLAVSIPPQATMLRELTADSLKIVTAVKSEMNPESFEPATADFAAMSRAKAFFSTGQFPFEKTLAESLGSNIEIVDTSIGIQPLYGTHDNCGHDHGSAEAAELSGHSHIPDPHIWTSVKNAKLMARNMTDALVKIDPEYAAKYRTNLELMEDRLDSLDSQLAQKLNDPDRRSFLVWHPSLSYFARDYGLEQIALGAENKETSVNQMRQQIDHASSANVAAIFIQSSYDSRQASNIASQLRLHPATINAMDPDWEGQLSKIADIIHGK